MRPADLAHAVRTLDAAEATVRTARAHLAEALRFARIERGWSQPELARRIGCNVSMVRAIEGHAKPPSRAMAARWIAAVTEGEP